MHEYQLQERLEGLLQAASTDSQAVLEIRDLPEGCDGFTIPSPDFSGRSHPFTTVRRALETAGLEGTVLHEAAHWRLGHVTNAGHRDAVEAADARAAVDVVRAPDEVAADEFALATILSTSRATSPPMRAVQSTSRSIRHAPSIPATAPVVSRVPSPTMPPGLSRSAEYLRAPLPSPAT